MTAVWTNPTDLTVNHLVTHTELITYICQNLLWLYENPMSETDHGVAALMARASGDLTTTGAWQDVPGCTVTLGGSGLYLLAGVFHGVAGGGVAAHYLSGRLLVNNVAQTGNIFMQVAAGAEGAEGMVVQMWLYDAASAGLVAKLQAMDINNTQDVVKGTDSVLVAFQGQAP